jgi:hypothetical protein
VAAWENVDEFLPRRTSGALEGFLRTECLITNKLEHTCSNLVRTIENTM